MKILITLLLFFFSISFVGSSFAQDDEYRGTQKFLKGVGADYDKEGKGFDIEYVLEGVLHNFILVDSASSSVTFEYDSKGIAEDVLIIYLPIELIEDPLSVYINGEKEPRAIRGQVGEITRMIIPLYEDSKTITINALYVISKDSALGEKILDEDPVEQKSSEKTQEIEDSPGGGCLIATATYGSELAPQVQLLRELRDVKLLHTELGTSFMQGFNDFYYSFSPIIADYERENPIFKETVKITITPMIASLSILNYLDMDSESSVLGYGIGVIMLNVGMYVGIPVLTILGIKKFNY